MTGRGAAVVIAPVLLWAVLVDGGVVEHRALAGPIATALALARAVGDGSLPADLAWTALRVALGVALGLLVGLPLGFLSGVRASRRRSLEPALDFLRAVPPLLIFPLILLALGYGEEARVAVIAWAAALAAALHVSAAAARPREERVRALRAMAASRWQMFRWLHLYELLPGALTALRHAVATGLVVAVVCEMIVGAPHGLGSRAVAAQVAYDAPALYAVILTTGATGWAGSRLLLAVERRVVSWRA